MKDVKTLNNIVEAIRSSKKSLVLAHQNPDGDTLGSMLAIGAVLKKSGHVVDHIMADPVPEIYRFLPYTELVKLPTDKNLQENYDIAFSLDCGSLKRLGSAKELWLKAAFTINIDHHISNENFGKINWIDAEATSTGQLVYWLAKSINIEITKEIATLLYTTLLTDTNCFANSNTNALALSWGSELIKAGAQHEVVYKKAFLERPFRSMKTFAKALDNLTLVENGEIAWTWISKDEMKKISAMAEDAVDVADYMMRTRGVKVGVFFREEENETKVSLRSAIDFDVSKIAMSMGGGGHKRAAGINIKSPLPEVKDLVLKKIVDEYKNHNGRK